MAVKSFREELRSDASKFRPMSLPHLPANVREELHLFVEGISSYEMMSLRAVRRASELPRGASLHRGDNPAEAMENASKAYKLRSMLRRTIMIRSAPLNQLLEDGTMAAGIAARGAGRGHDLHEARTTAITVAHNEISKKVPPDLGLEDQICVSAGFLASMIALQDLSFAGKELYTKHARERWRLIEWGFGIYAYDGTAPLLFCVREGGTTSHRKGIIELMGLD